MQKLDLDAIRYQAELRYAESRGDFSGTPRKLPSAQLEAVLASVVEAINKAVDRANEDKQLKDYR